MREDMESELDEDITEAFLLRSANDGVIEGCGDAWEISTRIMQWRNWYEDGGM
jgi:hypothetical protein